MLLRVNAITARHINRMIRISKFVWILYVRLTNRSTIQSLKHANLAQAESQSLKITLLNAFWLIILEFALLTHLCTTLKRSNAKAAQMGLFSTKQWMHAKKIQRLCVWLQCRSISLWQIHAKLALSDTWSIRQTTQNVRRIQIMYRYARLPLRFIIPRAKYVSLALPD